MSQTQVLATTKALLEHVALGFKAKIVALSAGDPDILTDVQVVSWSLEGIMQPATKVNVMLRPGDWRFNPKNEGRPHRDAFSEVEIDVELFHSDPAILEKNLPLLATAMAQTIDGIVDYSMANAGTIADLEDPVTIVFGSFRPSRTMNSFTCRATVFERSSQ